MTLLRKKLIFQNNFRSHYLISKIPISQQKDLIIYPKPSAKITFNLGRSGTGKFKR